MTGAMTDPAPALFESAPGLFADVVFDRPLDHAYTYAVPPHLAAAVAVGKRVACPFGRGNTGTPGYVVGLGTTAPPRATKAITKVLDDEPLVDDHLLALTRWMADYYLCGWGQVLHAVVPAGVRAKAGLRQATFVEPVPPDDLPDPVPTVTPKQKLALQALKAENRPVELGELGRLAKCGPAPVRGLIDKRLIRRVRRTVPNGPRDQVVGSRSDTAGVPHTPIVLNSDQEAALATVLTAVNAGGFKPLLLHGVTGSGKTEIYLRAIEDVVRAGKEVIVLVPEISLTPQTLGRFEGRLGGIAVLHSHLTDADRGTFWRKIAGGDIQVVVGARSAVFAPTRNLGLIVIDEEHESTFKQDNVPRYHARDVAVKRAQLAGVPVLLGSATPSLESLRNAKLGHYGYLSLPARVAGRPLPKVELVDLRHEPKGPNKFAAVGPTLEAAIKTALKAGGQVMLLLNRRGFSTHIHCPACGYVAQCKHCDLSLTFHRGTGALSCHYCGYETEPIKNCPVCTAPAVKYFGLGTEKLQEEVEQKFPDRAVARMDSDTMSKPGSHERVLTAFREGLIHILLGTQMIAKGLDFPNVTLVGVVNADTGLHVPDFRAAERTFQLLAQVAGRAGRGDKGGRVLVQTYTPEHPAVALAAKHDYAAFAELELAHRRAHNYPPFQRLARVIVRSLKEDAAGAFADTLAGAFREAVKRSSEPVRVLGPAECPVFKLNDYYRFHFQVQAAGSGPLHKVLREATAAAKPPGGVEFQVDVDPYGML